jgi:hypothetical protein
MFMANGWREWKSIERRMQNRGLVSANKEFIVIRFGLLGCGRIAKRQAVGTSDDLGALSRAISVAS